MAQGPECKEFSGDDWSQYEGDCPMPGYPVKNARLGLGDSEPFLARPRPLPPVGEGVQSFKTKLQYTGTVNYAVLAAVQARVDEEGCGAVMGAMKRWREQAEAAETESGEDACQDCAPDNDDDE